MTTFTMPDVFGERIPNTLHNDSLYEPSSSLGEDVASLLREIGFSKEISENTYVHKNDPSLVAQWLKEDKKLTIEYKGCNQHLVLDPEDNMEYIVMFVLNLVRKVYQKGSKV